ncbi:MAG: Mrp/NBP35 family ATP-binding protein [Anaerolineae bacterium]
MTTIADIREALNQVMDPDLHKSILELGMARDISYQDNIVSFTLALTTMGCPMRNQMIQDARTRLMALPDVKDVQVETREMTSDEKKVLFGEPKTGSAEAYNRIKQVIAVISGKGGVGKSSVSALLAVTLQRRGYAVGILDADITGPSIPKMLLQDNQHPRTNALGILPVESASGIKIMSINLLLADPNQAVIWRGPLIAGAIKQFWGDVYWGDLDYLIIDLPPGTSDASLTVMQSIPLNGIVLVTSPQGLAAMVVRKAASMAAQLDIALLGIVENMSYAICPKCGEHYEVFGPSHAAELAEEMEIPLLARLPIDPKIAELGDGGALETYPAVEFEALVDTLLEVTPAEACEPIG